MSSPVRSQKISVLGEEVYERSIPCMVHPPLAAPSSSKSAIPTLAPLPPWPFAPLYLSPFVMPPTLTPVALLPLTPVALLPTFTLADFTLADLDTFAIAGGLHAIPTAASSFLARARLAARLGPFPVLAGNSFVARWSMSLLTGGSLLETFLVPLLSFLPRPGRLAPPGRCNGGA